MSLLTDALRLRERRADKKLSRIEDLPPFRTPKPYKAPLVGVACLAVLVVLAYWRGVETYDWLERIVLGLPPKPQMAASTAPAEPEDKVPPDAVPLPMVEAKAEVVAKPKEQKKPSGAKPERWEHPTSLPSPEPNVAQPPVPSAGAATSPARARALPPGLASGGGAMEKAKAVPADLQPMDLNLSLAMIEDEKARQQPEEETQRKTEAFLRPMDVRGASHQGPEPKALPGTVPAAMLQPVVVTSVERVKNMDPKILEQERRNRVETFLAGLRVQGVRIQGSESRIMVDGNLITLGEPIGDFGLRLKSVESGRLIFVDEKGKEYLKSY